MSFKVLVQPSGHEFSVEADETVLDAALRQGYTIPYGCRSGACGACQGKVLEGEVNYGEEAPYGLKDEDVAEGKHLLCSAYASSDLTVEIHEISSADEIQIRNLPTKIHELNKLNEDVIQVKLKLPEGERLQFLAGQYVEFILEGDRRRAFSIANAPHDDDFLEFHIRHIAGGFFTDHLFSDMPEKEMVRIEGPHGNFYLREDSERPIIMLATGTGFGPIKGIIEHAIAEGCKRPIYLYWGARTQDGLYCDAMAKQWAADNDNIHYRPVLSRPTDGDNWDGRTGHVQDAVQADFDDLNGFELYACGHPDMVYTAKDSLTAKGMDPEHCFSDAFEYAKS